MAGMDLPQAVQAPAGGRGLSPYVLGAASAVAGMGAGGEEAALLGEKAAAVNRLLENMDVKLRFRVEQDSGTVKILVVDGRSGQVVRTVPPEYFSRVSAPAAASGTTGIVIDESA